MLELNLLWKILRLKGGSLLLFITLTLISTTSCTVNVTYLRGVPRLRDTSYWDYYFLCNTVGVKLLWNVNNRTGGLGGFSRGEVGEVISSSLVNSSYNWTLTLLSSKPLTDGQFTFDSVLIVSFPDMSSLDVACTNGSSLNWTSNVYNGKGVQNNNSTNSIFLEYLLTEDIVGDKSSQTSIFICGVQGVFMYWSAGTSNGEYGFREMNNVGTTRRNNLEHNATTVKQQAILIAHEPYRIVSVFLVTDTSDVTATCGDNQKEVSLSSSFNSASMPQDQTDPETTSSSSTTTGGGTKSTIGDTPSTPHIIIGVVIGAVGVIVVVVVVFTVTCACCCCYKKRNQQQQQPQEIPLQDRNQQPQPQQPLEIPLQDRNQHQQPQQPQERPLQFRVTPPEADSTYASEESLHERVPPIIIPEKFQWLDSPAYCPSSFIRNTSSQDDATGTGSNSLSEQPVEPVPLQKVTLQEEFTE